MLDIVSKNLGKRAKNLKVVDKTIVRGKAVTLLTSDSSYIDVDTKGNVVSFLNKNPNYNSTKITAAEGKNIALNEIKNLRKDIKLKSLLYKRPKF